MRRQTVKVQPRVDSSKWFDDDFEGVKLKNFDEMRENFIEDLTNQFSDLLVPTSTKHSSTRLPQSAGLNVSASDQQTVDEKPDQEMEDVQDEEEKKEGENQSQDSNSEENLGDGESDEEDSNMIPDEKPDEATGTMGDDSVIELDLTH